MPWTQVEPGVRYAPLPLSAHVRGDLGLVSLAPGVRLPTSARDASDLTFVVAGSYVGDSVVYQPGDVADAGQASRTDVIADAETGCICLIASEAQDIYRSRVSG
jgi:anti-sigma factor ChrR (cupin superfamily)